MKKFFSIMLISAVSQFAEGVFAQSSFPTALDHQLKVKTDLSPNAASLGKYGDFEVDMFTGTTSIGVPIYVFKEDEFEIPISLAYKASGIKSGERAGVCGLGWSMAAGGQISRRANGTIDEYYNHKNTRINLEADKGYYFKGSWLNMPNWNSVNYLEAFLDTANVYMGVLASDLQPDEFTFNFGKYSGSFYRTEQGNWKVIGTKGEVFIIEEEVDNSETYEVFGNFSKDKTKILELDTPINSNGRSKVSSLFTRFTITAPDGYKYIFGGSPSTIEFTRQSYGDGLNGVPDTDYTKDKTENWISANTWYLAKIISPTGAELNLEYKKGRALFQVSESGFSQHYDQVFGMVFITLGMENTTIINPCYLVAIAGKNKRVEFTYSKAIELEAQCRVAYSYDSNPSDGDPEARQGYSLNDKIFHWNDVKYDLLNKNPQYLNTLFERPPLNAAQLDSVKVIDLKSNNNFFYAKLNHSADPQNRRTLNSVSISSSPNQAGIAQKYSFDYLNVSGMEQRFYTTLAYDHWGYMTNYYSPGSGPYMAYNRRPNPPYTFMGMLNKITYPTGGYTELAYEPGFYGSYMRIDPNEAVPVLLTQDTGTAGVRVKSYTNYDYLGAPPVKTEFFYNKNYVNGGNTSSGILGMLPRYRDAIKYYTSVGTNPGPNKVAWVESNSNGEWLGQYKGGIINYSEVTKKNNDGSYVVYNFSNSDNSEYKDQIHDAQAIIRGAALEITYSDNFRITSNDIERGKLLSEKYYSNTNNLVKEVNNTYNTDPNRKSAFIRAIAKKELATPDAYGSNIAAKDYRLWAYKIYTYPNLLSKKTEKIINADGSYAYNEMNIKYDDYGNPVSSSSQTSDGRIQTTLTKYNSHPDYNGTASSGAALGVKKLMQDYKIKNYPVEQTIFQSQVGSLSAPEYVSGSLVTFRTDKPLIDEQYKLELTVSLAEYHATLAPNGFVSSKNSSAGFFQKDIRFKPTVSAISYTNVAGILPKINTVEQKNNEFSGLAWDYKGILLTATIQNGRYEDLAYSGFEGDYSGANSAFKNHWDFDHTQIQQGTTVGGKNYLQIPTTTTLAANQATLKSDISLNSGMKYRIAFWAKSTNSVNLYLANGTGTTALTPVKALSNGWQYYEYEFVSNGQTVGIICYTSLGIAGSSQLDEVMLCPAKSKIESYSYDTRSDKMSTLNNGSGGLAQYEYDGFGRLIRVLNEEGKILNANEYKLQTN